MGKVVMHVGIRPKFPTKEVKVDEITYYFEKQTGKYWTKREMGSGCMGVTEKKTYGIYLDLLYCNHCDEWFSDKQFEEVR